MNIVITGASRGIGFETAKILAKEHTVICISRRAEQSKIPGIIPIAFDFETGNITQNLIPAIKKHVIQVDILINNAATLVNKPFAETSPADFKKVFQVNFLSIVEFTQALLPLLRKAHILNIAGMGGIQGSVKFAGLSAYSASKGALITLTECLAVELKEQNIACNALAFGSVQTEMLEEAFPGFKAPISAAEAAKFVSNFALTGNKYFNGKILQMALSTP